MLRQASLRPEDTLLSGQDPSRPKYLHLYGRIIAGREDIRFEIPRQILSRPSDDYDLDVESFRACFDTGHMHLEDPDRSPSTTLPSGFDVRPHIFQLDGNGSDDDDDGDDGSPAAKRVKRAPRAKGLTLRISLSWINSKIPNRKIETGSLEELTPRKLIHKLNGLLFNMWKKEFAGLGFSSAPEFSVVEESSRVVLALPPLAAMSFSFLSGTSTEEENALLWHFLGFLDLSVTQQSPFQRGPRGIFVVTNFSPFKTRLYVGDCSIHVDKRLYDPSLPEAPNIEAAKALQEKLDTKLTVNLARVRSVGEFEFDLTGISSLRDANAKSTLATPPSLSIAALDSALTLAFTGFGMSSSYTAFETIEEEQQAATSGDGDGDDDYAAGFPSIDKTSFPKLRIKKINPFIDQGRLQVNVSGGAEATALLGFGPGELNFTFDAGLGYTSSKSSSFLRPESSLDDWDEENDGSIRYAMSYVRMVMASCAKDTLGDSATLLGPLTLGRKAAYLVAQQSDTLSLMPENVVAPCRSTDSGDTSLYEMAKSDYLDAKKDAGRRAWLVLTRTDSQKRVVPEVLDDWKATVYLETWIGAHPDVSISNPAPQRLQSSSEPSGAASQSASTPVAPEGRSEEIGASAAAAVEEEAAAGRPVTEIETKEAEGSQLFQGVDPTAEFTPQEGKEIVTTKPGGADGEGQEPEPVVTSEAATTTTTAATTTTTTTTTTTAAEASGETPLTALQKDLEAQKTYLTSVMTAGLPIETASPGGPLSVEEEEEQQQQPASSATTTTTSTTATTTYACVGFNQKSLLRLCPGVPGTTPSLPDQFHLTIVEAERRDWLGPLGYSAYSGTFKSPSGERVRSNLVLLRGGSQLSGLTARLYYPGYDTYVAPANGIAFAICKFHPHRSKELAALSSLRLLQASPAASFF